jgi:hypothetical protein
MHRYLLYLLLFCNLIFLFLVKKISLKLPNLPFWWLITLQLKTISGQGSNSHKITDMWYYVDDKFKGVFPVGKMYAYCI